MMAKRSALVLFNTFAFCLFACKSSSKKQVQDEGKKIYSGVFDDKNNAVVIPLPEDLAFAPLSEPGQAGNAAAKASGPKGLNLADEASKGANQGFSGPFKGAPIESGNTATVFMDCYGEDKSFKADNWFAYTVLSQSGTPIAEFDKPLQSCDGGQIQLALRGLVKNKTYEIKSYIYYRFDPNDRSKVRIEYEGTTKPSPFKPGYSDQKMVLEKKYIDQNINVSTEKTPIQLCDAGGGFWNGTSCIEGDPLYFLFAYTQTTGGSSTTSKIKSAAKCMSFGATQLSLGECKAEEGRSARIKFHQEGEDSQGVFKLYTIVTRDDATNPKCLFVENKGELHLGIKPCPKGDDGVVPSEFLFSIRKSLEGDKMGINTFFISAFGTARDNKSQCVSVPFASSSTSLTPQAVGSRVDLKPCKGQWSATANKKTEEESTVRTQYFKILQSSELSKE